MLCQWNRTFFGINKLATIRRFDGRLNLRINHRVRLKKYLGAHKFQGCHFFAQMAFAESLSVCYEDLFGSTVWKFGMTCSAFFFIVFTILCLTMGIVRRRGLDPRTAITRLDRYPMISVVMCCKGVHSQSLHNFKRNLRMEYPGPAEFIFVVEDESDPAHACAQRAINETPFESKDRSVSIVVAGVSWHNAQKCHNMLFGVAASDPNSEYVLFVDDDAFLYPGLLEELVHPLIREPEKVLVSTGYEFIVVPPHGSLATYCLMFYRLHNLFSFITTRPILCWGGCWMSPLWVFRQNFADIVDCYIDGGYSDDTIVSCLAQENGYLCAHPYRAIFPQHVDPNISFSRYWDFMSRQFFVTDTYSTEYNKSVNHSLVYLICGAIYLIVIWILFAPFGGVVTLLARFLCDDFRWTYGSVIAVMSFPGWVWTLYAVQFATDSMVLVANSVRPPDQQSSCKMNKFMAALGLIVHAMGMPISVLKCRFSSSCIWSRVKYYKEHGKISKVERPDENGNYTVSELAQVSMARCLSDTRIKAMVERDQEQFNIA